MKIITSYIFLIMCLPVVARVSNDFSLDTLRSNMVTNHVNIVTNKNLTFKVPTSEIINGLSVDGTIFKKEAKHLLRIILKDIYGKEYLIMESYNEIYDESNDVFSNYCEETAYINNVKPDSILIIAIGVNLRIDNIRYTINNNNLLLGQNSFDKEVPGKIRKRQVEEISRRINTYNHTHDKLWRADVTPLSLKKYEDKKRILGFDDNTCTEGIEYYAEGIIELGDINDRGKAIESRTNFVESFDWRNRHGKNWITSNKDQMDSGFCCAFTAVATVEALARLYYNQLINFDLSEQEAACCNGNSNPWNGMFLSQPLKYIRDYGVCDEIAYPFVNDPLESLYCRSSTITPNELIKIGGYTSVTKDEDSMKSALINHGPLASSVNYWGYNSNQSIFNISHAMSIVGYGQLHEGDTIFHWIDNNGFMNGAYTVNPGDPRIGMTYWIYKNSYGTDYDTALNGYMHIIHYNYSNSVMDAYYCLPSITSMNYSDSNIVCEDADGDGYYFWGIGPKPSWCPSWVPNIPDGNDNNSSKGLMDQNGNLESLSTNNTYTVSGNVTYTSNQTLKCNIRIPSNTSLTIKNTLNLFGRVKIYIESNGQLIIDGGVVTNADINMSSGGKITLKNGGIIVIQTGKDFIVPTGATLDTEEGKIIRSNDF